MLVTYINIEESKITKIIHLELWILGSSEILAILLRCLNMGKGTQISDVWPYLFAIVLTMTASFTFVLFLIFPASGHTITLWSNQA